MQSLPAGLSALAISTRAAPETAFGYPASKITVNSQDPMGVAQSSLITAGCTRSQVLALLGQPAREVAPDVYQYDHCRPDVATDPSCHILIVIFFENRVSGLRFVNAPAAIEANFFANVTRRGAASPVIVAGLATLAT
jgi:hypothetical protein